MSNSHVPRIELNKDDTINLVVNVYGFDAGTSIEISGQATQSNGAVATFYSVQNMPASKEESAILRVESVPAVPPNKFVAGFPITVVIRAAEAWITTLEADTDEHEQAMEEGSRQTEQMRLTYELEIAKLRTQTWLSAINLLSAEQRTPAVAELIQMLKGNTESIANDTRLRETRMLEIGEQAATETVEADLRTEPE